MAAPIQIPSGMNDALCPLSRNVVSANAARPSGAGSAGMNAGLSISVAAIRPPLDEPQLPPTPAAPAAGGRTLELLPPSPEPKRRAKQLCSRASLALRLLDDLRQLSTGIRCRRRSTSPRRSGLQTS